MQTRILIQTSGTSLSIARGSGTPFSSLGIFDFRRNFGIILAS
jgi:hypothetical protein